MFRRLLVVVALLTALIGVSQGASAANPFDPKPVLPPSMKGASNRLAGVDAANTYVWRSYPSGVVYDGLTHQNKVEQVNTSQGFFFAEQFGYTGSTNNGYIGLQTKLYLGSFTAKGAIFSIWGATSCSAVAFGATCYDFTEGGAGKSIHYQFNWSTGRFYALSVYLARDASGNLTGEAQAFLVDTVSHGQVYIGSLTVPTSYGGFDGTEIVEWTEQYDPASYAACTDIPVVKDVVNQWAQVRNAAGMWLSPTASTPNVQTGTGCTNSAVVNLGGGSYRKIIGALS